MTEFHADGQPTEKTIKIKDYKLVNQLNRDTESDKLTWNNTLNDKSKTIFSTTYGITKQKKMTFTVVCSQTSIIKEDNVLRVILKVENDRGVSKSVSVIKTLYLVDYPLLNVLMRKLHRKYLGKEFISPINNEKTPETSKAVEVNSVEEYRKHILTEIKEIMKKLPGQASEWESKFMDVFVAYDEAKKSKSYEDLNDLLQKAIRCVERWKDKPKVNSWHGRDI